MDASTRSENQYQNRGLRGSRLQARAACADD